MKKTFRSSQIKDVLGERVTGFQMHRYGLPYGCPTGAFFPEDEDSLDLMFVAAQQFPELHIVTDFRDDTTVNRYATGDVWCYYLYLGNADPNIEFTAEFDPEDWTPEQRKASQQRIRDCLSQPYSPLQKAAIQWSMARMGKLRGQS